MFGRKRKGEKELCIIKEALFAQNERTLVWKLISTGFILQGKGKNACSVEKKLVSLSASKVRDLSALKILK